MRLRDNNVSMSYSIDFFKKDLAIIKKQPTTISHFFWDSGDVRNFFFCWLEKCYSCTKNLRNEKLLFWLTKMPKYQIKNLFQK